MGPRTRTIRMGDTRPGAPEARFERAIALLAEGDDSSALDELRVAQVEFAAAGDLGNAAICDMNVGALLEEQDAFDEALQHLGRAADYFDAMGRTAELAEVRLSQGLVLERLGDQNASEQSYREALALARASEQEPTLAMAAMNLGGLLEAKGVTEDALALFEQAESILVQLDLVEQVDECRAAILRLRNRD